MCLHREAFGGFATKAKWWTCGESHSGFVHAMDACYYYTTGPIPLMVIFKGDFYKKLHPYFTLNIIFVIPNFESLTGLTENVGMV